MRCRKVVSEEKRCDGSLNVLIFAQSSRSQGVKEAFADGDDSSRWRRREWCSFFVEKGVIEVRACGQ